MRAVVVGDSQAQGLLPVLGPILARHGYDLDADRSWAHQGAGIDAITEHARAAGPADLAIVLTGGGNDTAQSLRDAGASYREKLHNLVGTLRFAGVQSIVLVGPMISDDPEVQRRHDAARQYQAQGVPGARWIDGYRLSAWVPHPDGNPTHWTRNGYQAIAGELEKAIWSSGTVTAIGLVGTLTFLGGLGMLVMESLYERARTA